MSKRILSVFLITLVYFGFLSYPYVEVLDFEMDTSLSNSDASYIDESTSDNSGWSLSTADDINGNR
ncbi:hypothetical protein GF362_02495 [Candidatus Dojkabacteria bacterium]|nr:hypothetical protein [Candidatus Dojkabacteria bacterium]